MSVWISDEKLLIFVSLISPSKMILFEKKYETFDTVFHHQMKHCISCLLNYIKVENIGAVVYVGSSLTVHNPLFFVHTLWLRCFYWSVSLK